MATLESLIADIDRIIAYYNARTMDLPDHFFGRTTQFVINGAPFETLLGRSPSDPLILMLARGPAGYRFTIKALQHAIPDSRLERGDVEEDGSTLSLKLWLSGTLRGTAEAIRTAVPIALTLSGSRVVDVAAATVDADILAKIRDARLRA
jgi:hypothetical protein